ncbi:MAG: hypothetical protein JXA60_11180, partial [Candidatus Coatesbacteria bacterium]|nr:hypothetical protein [Candidatus Coatesbacteria bacterium]
TEKNKELKYSADSFYSYTMKVLSIDRIGSALIEMRIDTIIINQQGFNSYNVNTSKPNASNNYFVAAYHAIINKPIIIIADRNGEINSITNMDEIYDYIIKALPDMYQYSFQIVSIRKILREQFNTVTFKNKISILFPLAYQEESKEKKKKNRRINIEPLGDISEEYKISKDKLNPLIDNYSGTSKIIEPIYLAVNLKLLSGKITSSGIIQWHNTDKKKPKVQIKREIAAKGFLSTMKVTLIGETQIKVEYN